MTDEKDTKPNLGGALSANLPTRKKKLTIWAIRSVIAVGAAYAIVAMNGPGWLVWAAWAYVAVTLALAFVLSKPQ